MSSKKIPPKPLQPSFTLRLHIVSTGGSVQNPKISLKLILVVVSLLFAFMLLVIIGIINGIEIYGVLLRHISFIYKFVKIILLWV